MQQRFESPDWGVVAICDLLQRFGFPSLLDFDQICARESVFHRLISAQTSAATMSPMNQRPPMQPVVHIVPPTMPAASKAGSAVSFVDSSMTEYVHASQIIAHDDVQTSTASTLAI